MGKSSGGIRNTRSRNKDKNINSGVSKNDITTYKMWFKKIDNYINATAPSYDVTLQVISERFYNTQEHYDSLNKDGKINYIKFLTQEFNKRKNNSFSSDSTDMIAAYYFLKKNKLWE